MMRPEYEVPETRKAEGPLSASTLKLSSPDVAFSEAMLLRVLPRERLQRTPAPGPSGFAKPGGTTASGPPLPSSTGAACEVTASVQRSAPRAPTRGRTHAVDTSSGDGSAGAAKVMARKVTSTHVRSVMMGAAEEARPEALAHKLAVTVPEENAVAEATDTTPLFVSAKARAPEGAWLAIEYEMLRGRPGAADAS